MLIRDGFDSCNAKRSTREANFGGEVLACGCTKSWHLLVDLTEVSAPASLIDRPVFNGLYTNGIDMRIKLHEHIAGMRAVMRANND